MKFAKGSKKEASVNVQEIKGVTRAYTGAPPQPAAAALSNAQPMGPSHATCTSRICIYLVR